MEESQEFFYFREQIRPSIICIIPKDELDEVVHMKNTETLQTSLFYLTSGRHICHCFSFLCKMSDAKQEQECEGANSLIGGKRSRDSSAAHIF
jgi:hypothetical protein